MTRIRVTSPATPSLGSSSRRAVSHSPSGGVTARCDALLSPSLHSHRHLARGHGPQSPRASSVHPLKSPKQSSVRLAREKGCKLSCPGSSGARPPAEDKPARCRCSSTEALLSAATRLEPREFCLCDFLRLIVSSLAHSQIEP